MKLVTTKFKLGGLHEKHVVATWNLGNHLSICFWAQGNQYNFVFQKIKKHIHFDIIFFVYEGSKRVVEVGKMARDVCHCCT